MLHFNSPVMSEREWESLLGRLLKTWKSLVLSEYNKLTIVYRDAMYNVYRKAHKKIENIGMTYW